MGGACNRRAESIAVLWPHWEPLLVLEGGHTTPREHGAVVASARMEQGWLLALLSKEAALFFGSSRPLHLICSPFEEGGPGGTTSSFYFYEECVRDASQEEYMTSFASHFAVLSSSNK